MPLLVALAFACTSKTASKDEAPEDEVVASNPSVAPSKTPAAAQSVQPSDCDKLSTDEEVTQVCGWPHKLLDEDPRNQLGMGPLSCVTSYSGGAGVSVVIISRPIKNEQDRQLLLEELADTTTWKPVEGLGDKAGSQDSADRTQLQFLDGDLVFHLQTLDYATCSKENLMVLAKRVADRSS